MNTEFPSRIPKVTNTTTTSTTNSVVQKQAQDTSTFQKNAINIFQKVVDTLDKINNSVYNFTNKNPKTGSTVVNNSTVVKSVDSTNKPSVAMTIFQKAVDTLNNIRDTVYDIVQNGFHTSEGSTISSSNVKKKDNQDEDEKKKTVSFRQRIIKGFQNFSRDYQAGIKSLQTSVQATSMSLGNAIGNVFGGGLFSRMISGIITKSLNFAVSKILLGVFAANLPMLAIGAAIIAAIYFAIKYWEDIVEGVKWLGILCDQILERIKHPFSDDKYDEARKYLSEEFIIPEDTIKAIYGDTVRGRQQMYEDYLRAQEDPEFARELLSKFKGENTNINENIDRMMENAIKGTNQIDASTQIVDSYNTYFLSPYDTETMNGIPWYDPDYKGAPMSEAIPSMNTNVVNNNYTPIIKGYGTDNANLERAINPFENPVPWAVTTLK